LLQFVTAHDEIKASGAQVLAIGPDPASSFEAFWQAHEVPFPGIADPKGELLRRFGQQIIWWRFGRMPSVLLIDRVGRVRYEQRGKSMRDIASPMTILMLLSTVSQVG
jgi:peroxiredoxin